MLRWGRVEATGGFLLLMAWLNYADQQGLLLPALAACVLHELGHLLAVRLCGGAVERLRLSAVGAELRLGRGLSYGRELLCALAGPAANLAAALAWARTEGGALFAGVNLALGCFNLLPAGRLDGGRALRCVLAPALGPDRAGRLGERLDRALSLLLVGAGCAAVCRGGGFTLLLVALWLACPGREGG